MKACEKSVFSFCITHLLKKQPTQQPTEYGYCPKIYSKDGAPGANVADVVDAVVE